MNLLILAILLSLLPLLIDHVYASVYITDIRLMPADMKINDTLVIEANVINNSNDIISYPSLCSSPLDAEFDDNIAVEYGVGCLGFAIETLEPFENATVRGPSSGIFYKVVDQGLTRSNITFTYLVGEEKKSVSKEIIFMIDEREKVEDRFDMSINQTVSFNDLKITLIDIEDSRCHIDVTCVWEGDARLSLAIERDGFIDNFVLSSHQPLLINNYAIELLSLKPDRTSNIEKEEYQAAFTIKESISNLKFKAYNERDGLIGTLSQKEGFIILFKDGKRELLQFTIKDDCNRLSSMICFNTDDIHIEIGNDFMLVNKQYIPTVNVKAI